MTRPRRCLYCGHPCFGLACRGHRDLLELDPHHTSDLKLPPKKRGKRPRSFVEQWVGA